MDAIKKQRKVLRTAFTKALNAFAAKVDSDCSREEKLVAFQFLETKMTELDTVHSAYNQWLFQSDMEDADIAKELESDDAYKTHYLTAKMKVTPSMPESVPRTVSTNIAKTSKFPKLELPKFSGNVKDWLPFWSQFKKINDDPSITNEDRFQYLLQATVPDSRANELVKSFPPTGDNYEKAITSLKSRFGRDDIIVEFYVRELLSLVLQNAVKGNSKLSLASIYDKIECYIRALESLGVTTDKCAAMLYPLVESSLPEEVLRAWQRSGHREQTRADGQPESTDRLARLLTFLQVEVENEERIDMALTGFGLSTEQEKKKPKGKTESPKDTASASVLLVAKDQKRSECIFCKASHDSQSCEAARKLPLEERKEIVKRENCCFNCLKRGHISQRCRVKSKCDWCSRRHVLLMCPGILCKKDAPVSKPDDNGKTVDDHTLAALCESPDVCLQTLRVKLYSETREKIVRAIIDTASQRSYIRADVARELGYVSLGKLDVAHSLFGGIKSECKTHDIFKARIKSLDDSYKCNFSVMNQNVICGAIASFKEDRWLDELQARNIHLTDVGDKDNSIDILIGADVAGKLLTGRKYDLENGLTAIETYLGWTVLGKLPTKVRASFAAVTIVTMFVQETNPCDLWRLDTIGIKDSIEKTDKSERDIQTREFLIETTRLNADGRYEVKLPWTKDHMPVSSNYEIARSRLKKCLEKLGTQKLFKDYNNVFKEWLSEGIIERVPDDEIDNPGHYLPHRPVLKMHSTTKIRPVFDASACRKGYPSLNHCLEKGPNLIELIPSSLNRFREGEIGVISDIKKAFLQIAVNKADCDLLRFFWVVDNEIVVFRHRRVVFGLACSPFILAAILELHLSASLGNTDKKNSIEKLKRSFYVDNCIASVDTQDELEAFIIEATALMSSGGFELRGWENSGNAEENETTLVLGILWNKRKDTIAINPSVLEKGNPEAITKRTILSATHKIFDPIGFTCPTSLLSKLLIKELWADKIDWDAEATESQTSRFTKWLKDLPVLNQIEIPRKLGKGNLSLHTFSDASGVAYAAAVFARIEQGGDINVILINAKSRIAPNKATIPRLELMAATIAVRLTASVVKSLTREISDITFWSDSTTVLAWIKRDAPWSTFVSNRVKEIRSFEKGKWRHVPGALNPADLPSRGCSPSQLLKSKWWLGPKWLYDTELNWPTASGECEEEEVKSEMKKSALIDMVNVKDSTFKVGHQFSSYNKLVRFLAWMHRFIKNTKRENKRNSHEIQRNELRLTLAEIKAAEVRLFKFLQDQMFSYAPKGKLASFKTMRNEDGLLVLKTKIFNRKDDINFLCPILLDSTHEIIYMLVKEEHEILGHAGTQIVMCQLRERLWIISLRKVLKRVIANCVVCKKQKAKRMESETPPLPADRVRDATVFEIVGIDFAGPLFFRGGGKGWICIFTCAVYRAIHLELASTLSTQGFLECLRRFIARRGRPRTIYSDNGTNFTGAAHALNKLNWEKIAKHNSAFQIEWRFNPPSAPWWGGWWERLIGVIKTILRKILGKASLSYESLNTILCDAEAIINARPLTYITEDPDDLKTLSPSMFLQEIREFGVPDCDILCRTRLEKKWRYRQKIRDDLRTRFRTEYLGQLLLKGSKSEKRKINIGDIVLIGDDLHKRIDWPMARVIDVIPGRDGLSRVLVLKTKSGVLKRPIQRIYPLEITREEIELNKNLCKTATAKKSSVKTDKCIFNDNDENLVDKQRGEDPDVVVSRSGRVIKKPDRLRYV